MPDPTSESLRVAPPVDADDVTITPSWAADERRQLLNVLPEHQVYPTGDPEWVAPVSRPEPGLLTRKTPIGAIGSCFASRVHDWLVDNGYTFVRTERPPASERISDEKGRERAQPWHQTCRFGVVWNVPCMAQRFLLGAGRFDPETRFWRRPDGRLSDPYRQGVSWADEADMDADLARHAEAIRRALQTCELFVVTPGLSEVWRNPRDGSVYATKPHHDDATRADFTVMSVDDTVAELERTHAVMREINPALRLIVSLSPVPFKASFRPEQHAVVSDCVSKAILRVAIDAFCRNHPEIVYFPAYEIVTKLTARPYMEDFRHVRESVVARVMRVFEACYAEPAETPMSVGAV